MFFNVTKYNNDNCSNFPLIIFMFLNDFKNTLSRFYVFLFHHVYVKHFEFPLHMKYAITLLRIKKCAFCVLSFFFFFSIKASQMMKSHEIMSQEWDAKNHSSRTLHCGIQHCLKSHVVYGTFYKMWQ